MVTVTALFWGIGIAGFIWGCAARTTPDIELSRLLVIIGFGILLIFEGYRDVETPRALILGGVALAIVQARIWWRQWSRLEWEAAC